MFSNPDTVVSKMYRQYFGTEDMSLDEKFFGEGASMSDNIQSIPDKIEPAVKKLENKGYRVKYASPGHSNTHFSNDQNKDGVINGKLVGTGRIIFEKDYHFENSPEGWSWKVLSNGFKALYVKPLSYNPDSGKSAKEAFLEWQSKYMSELNKWIEQLPHMGSDKDGKPDENFETKA